MLQRCVSHPQVIIKMENTIQSKGQPKVLQEVLQADMLAPEDLTEQRTTSEGTGGKHLSDFGVRDHRAL